MGNTQGDWILYGFVLSLNFLNADELMTIPGRQGIIAGIAELNHPKCSRNALTLKRK